MAIFKLMSSILNAFVMMFKSIFKLIGMDGFVHLFVSALIALFVCVMKVPMVWAAVIAMSVGVLKELCDKFFGGHANWHDIVCDVIGVMLGIALFAISAAV